MALASATSWALNQASQTPHNRVLSPFPFPLFPAGNPQTASSRPRPHFFPCASKTLFLLSLAFKFYSSTKIGNKSFLVFLTKLGTMNPEIFSQTVFFSFFVLSLPFRGHNTESALDRESAYKMAAECSEK